MKRSEFRPTPIDPAAGRVEQSADGFTLVFVRELRQPPERVWAALTDPAQLRQWAPFDPDRDLGVTGPATLVMAGGTGAAEERWKSEVLRAERPTLLEYTWDTDVVRWELAPSSSGGTRLTLRHRLGDPSWLARVTAGWHLCIDVLAHALAGDAFGRIVAEEAKLFGPALAEGYAAQFGTKV